MIHLFVSSALVERFGDLLTMQAKQPVGTDRWYAHAVPTGTGEFTLALEYTSRYGMVFYNLDPCDLRRFTEVFCRRLVREVVAVCQLQGDLAKHMTELIHQQCLDLKVDTGMEYDISGDMFDAARYLQEYVAELGSFPAVGVSEFSLGVKLNRHNLLVTGGPLTPIHAFAKIWLDRLTHYMGNRTKGIQP